MVNSGIVKVALLTISVVSALGLVLSILLRPAPTPFSPTLPASALAGDSEQVRRMLGACDCAVLTGDSPDVFGPVVDRLLGLLRPRRVLVGVIAAPVSANGLTIASVSDDLYHHLTLKDIVGQSHGDLLAVARRHGALVLALGASKDDPELARLRRSAVLAPHLARSMFPIMLCRSAAEATEATEAIEAIEAINLVNAVQPRLRVAQFDCKPHRNSVAICISDSPEIALRVSLIAPSRTEENSRVVPVEKMRRPKRGGIARLPRGDQGEGPLKAGVRAAKKIAKSIEVADLEVLSTAEALGRLSDYDVLIVADEHSEYASVLLADGLSRLMESVGWQHEIGVEAISEDLDPAFAQLVPTKLSARSFLQATWPWPVNGLAWLLESASARGTRVHGLGPGSPIIDHIRPPREDLRWPRWRRQQGRTTGWFDRGHGAAVRAAVEARRRGRRMIVLYGAAHIWGEQQQLVPSMRSAGLQVGVVVPRILDFEFPLRVREMPAANWVCIDSHVYRAGVIPR